MPRSTTATSSSATLRDRWGLQAPFHWMMPKDFVNGIKEMNGGRQELSPSSDGEAAQATASAENAADPSRATAAGEERAQTTATVPSRARPKPRAAARPRPRRRGSGRSPASIRPTRRRSDRLRAEMPTMTMQVVARLRRRP